jgi:hypothetical protein
MYFNFRVKINSPNRNKNIQYRWEKRAKYKSELNLSKYILSVGSSYNSDNDDFEEISGGRRKRRLSGV